jgi:uncharacterized protein YgbK (DUF1537 family)
LDTIAIIADDLTGACDSGVKLLNKGYRTEVIINSWDAGEINREMNDAVSVNTESRGMEERAAYDVVYSTAKSVKAQGIDRFYKKIDSVLRGNIGSEIDAMIDALGYQVAIVASALPNNGRIIREGKLSVIAEGVETAVYPVLESMAKGSRKKIGSIFLDTVRGGAEGIVAETVRLVGEGNEIIIFDSENNEDLERIAISLKGIGMDFLPVGTAGLINYLDRFWVKDGMEIPVAEVKSSLDVFIVVGTKHPITAKQVRELVKRDDVYIVALDVDNLDEEKAVIQTQMVLSDIQKNRALIDTKKTVILTTYTVLDENAGKNLVYTSNVQNGLITETITALANTIKELFSFKKIIVTGGDTASSLFNRLGAKKISLRDEPLPGIVTGNISKDELNLLISTKSGGFGDSQTLVKLLDYMAATAN